jgi:hypothetical protein
MPIPDGVISRRDRRQIAGNYLYAAVISKSVGGIFTPTGSLGRSLEAFRSPSGVFTPSGVLLRVVEAYRGLGGTFTPTGSLIAAINYMVALAGELGLEGALGAANPTWLLLDEELLWRGEWDAGTAYDINDVVLHKFGAEWHVFVSKAGHNTNNLPESSATWWRRFYQEQWM